MQPKSFLTGGFSLPIVPATYLSGDELDKEPIKLYLVGSLRGIASITHSLHSRGFAEVNDWSKPQPTGLPGEYVTVLVRQVIF